MPFIQVWPIKQILALFMFSASAYYRANWINKADITVCVCVRACVIFERYTFTFTFMHLADAFIQRDLHCIQVTVSTFFLSDLAFPGNRTHDLGVANAMLYQLSYRIYSTVNHKSKHCVHQQSFAASNRENVVLCPNKILLKAICLRYQPQIWNTTCLDLWL